MDRKNKGTICVPLGDVSQKVKQAVIIQQEVRRVALLRTNDIGTLDRVTAEEDRLPGTHLVSYSNEIISGKRAQTQLSPTIS